MYLTGSGLHLRSGTALVSSSPLASGSAWVAVTECCSLFEPASATAMRWTRVRLTGSMIETEMAFETDSVRRTGL